MPVWSSASPSPAPHAANNLGAPSGRLIENTDNPSMCRTQVTLHLDRPIDTLLTTPLANHHIILPGHI